jgi:hypothetical protein
MKTSEAAMKKEDKPNYTGETRKINVNDGGKVQVVGAPSAEKPAKEGGK